MQLAVDRIGTNLMMPSSSRAWTWHTSETPTPVTHYFNKSRTGRAGNNGTSAVSSESNDESAFSHFHMSHPRLDATVCMDKHLSPSPTRPVCGVSPLQRPLVHHIDTARSSLSQIEAHRPRIAGFLFPRSTRTRRLGRGQQDPQGLWPALWIPTAGPTEPATHHMSTRITKWSYGVLEIIWQPSWPGLISCL